MNLLGVDIGGTKIAAGLVDSVTGAVLLSDRTPTLAQEGGAAILGRAITLAQQVTAVARAQGLDAPIAVGIGAGGQIDYKTGVVLSATDILPGWAGTHLAESFAEAFGIPAFADNDVNAFALGEHRFGAAKGASDAVFLALGTGVGGATLINGTLHRGAHGTGGELGHLILWTDGERAINLEQYTAGGALLQYYRDAGGSLEWEEGSAIGRAAIAGEEAAIQAVSRLGRYLGIALASLANCMDTELFVIGGGVADLGDLLLEPARAILARHALPLYRDTPVLPAALGNDSSIVGAACVALSQI